LFEKQLQLTTLRTPLHLPTFISSHQQLATVDTDQYRLSMATFIDCGDLCSQQNGCQLPRGKEQGGTEELSTN